jgi:hypothetical protein
MEWGKLYASWYQHEKAIGLPLSAKGLWLDCFAWCILQNSRGRIPKKLVRSIAGMGEGSEGANLAGLLVDAGLWVEGTDSYQMHQFEEWQHRGLDVADALDERRRKDRERQAKRRGSRTSRDASRDSHVNSLERERATNVALERDSDESLDGDPEPPAGAREGGEVVDPGIDLSGVEEVWGRPEDVTEDRTAEAPAHPPRPVIVGEVVTPVDDGFMPPAPDEPDEPDDWAAVYAKAYRAAHDGEPPLVTVQRDMVSAARLCQQGGTKLEHIRQALILCAQGNATKGWEFDKVLMGCQGGNAAVTKPRSVNPIDARIARTLAGGDRNGSELNATARAWLEGRR